MKIILIIEGECLDGGHGRWRGAGEESLVRWDAKIWEAYV